MAEDNHAVPVLRDALCALLRDRECLEGTIMLAARHAHARVRDIQRLARLMAIMNQPDVNEDERRMLAEILEWVVAQVEICARDDAAVIATTIDSRSSQCFSPDNAIEPSARH
jgi:hypothetical protein